MAVLKACSGAIIEALITTTPVLTEPSICCHQGASRLRDFIGQGGLSLWFLDDAGVQCAFELLERYADHPLDFADASLMVAAEALRATKIFTVDPDDFGTYRIRRQYCHYQVEIMDR